MVLGTSTNRRIPLSENTPPSRLSRLHTKTSLASRIRTTINESCRRRTVRTNGVGKTPKDAIAHAKKKKSLSKPAASIRFKIAAVPSRSVADVEMKEAPKTTTVPICLPRSLARPEEVAISPDAISKLDPNLADVIPEFVKDALSVHAGSLLHSLTKVHIPPPPTKGVLPKELAILMNDMANSDPPSHIFAVYGTKKSADSAATTVKLFPFHAIVFSANCANLPPLTTPEPSGTLGKKDELNVPVVPLCMPFPQNFAHLLEYIYLKRPEIILSPPFLPTRLPENMKTDKSDRTLLTFAGQLAQTYTSTALIQHAVSVHGMWQNICALGIHEDDLWESLDLAWEILICAIAISTGNPKAVISDERLSQLLNKKPPSEAQKS